MPPVTIDTLKHESLRARNADLRFDGGDELSAFEIGNFGFVAIDGAPDAARLLGLSVTELSGQQLTEEVKAQLVGRAFAMGQELQLGERKVALLKIVMDLSDLSEIDLLLARRAGVDARQPPEDYVLRDGETIYSGVPIVAIAYVPCEELSPAG